MANSSISESSSVPRSSAPPPPPPPASPAPVRKLPTPLSYADPALSDAAVQPPMPESLPTPGAIKTTVAKRTQRWRGRDDSLPPEPTTTGLDGETLGTDSAVTGQQQLDNDGLAIERTAPAWLVSLVLHLLLLLLFALLTFPASMGVGSLLIELGKSEEAEDINLTVFDLEGPDTPNIDDVVDAETDIDQQFVLEPVVTPLKVEDLITPVDVGPIEVSMEVSASLSGRTGAMKDALMAAYGGTPGTAEAVKLGLMWLKRNQQGNGSWKLSGPFRDGAGTDNSPAATAMALLAFQGDGNTHLSGEYAAEVNKAIKWLIGQLDREGSFVTKSRVPRHQALYAQGQCTIAICELYAMTKDSWLREPAERAVNYACSIQAKEGGWRYDVGRETDTSVTGWFLMALQSAKMAGLEFPQESLSKVGYYLDTAQHYDGSAYSYQPGNAPSPAMTAEGLLCRQYLGWQRDTAPLREAVLTIDENYPFDYEERNFYYWYYATQVLHHYGGSPWENWNARMRVELPKAQIKTGREAGSWAPQGSRWGTTGGRLYTTCLAIYCLEVYYRHMPLYEQKSH